MKPAGDDDAVGRQFHAAGKVPAGEHVEIRAIERYRLRLGLEVHQE
jgi:hypothetical protein